MSPCNFKALREESLSRLRSDGTWRFGAVPPVSGSAAVPAWTFTAVTIALAFALSLASRGRTTGGRSLQLTTSTCLQSLSSCFVDCIRHHRDCDVLISLLLRSIYSLHGNRSSLLTFCISNFSPLTLGKL